MSLSRGQSGWRERVLAILAEMRPEAGAAPISGQARLQGDLGLDSLALVATALRLHEELGTDPAALAARAGAIGTVDDLLAAVEELRRDADRQAPGVA